MGLANNDVADGSDLLPRYAQRDPAPRLHGTFGSFSTPCPALHLPPIRTAGILNGSRSITADTLLRLGRYFNTTPQSWLNHQKGYELEVEKRSGGDLSWRRCCRCGTVVGFDGAPVFRSPCLRY